MSKKKPAPQSAAPICAEPVSRWRRFACMMYEGVLLFAVVFLAGYLFDTLTQSHSGMVLRHLRQFILFLAIGLYFVLSWRLGGQTLPMKTWNVRLLDHTGSIPGLARLLLRYILLWPIPLAFALLIKLLARASAYPAVDLLIVFTPFTVFIWTWFDPQKQFAHDRLAGTQLVSLASHQ